MPTAHATALSLCAMLGTLAMAQQVHQVGPGAIAQIQQAITLAAPGDVIVVAAGNYDEFTLDKALTVLAAVPNTVQVTSSSYAGAGVTFRIPTGATARIAGLHFRSPYPFFFGLQVQVTQGVVHFEDCLFEQGTHTYGAALEVHNSGVVLRHCWAIGSGGPLNQVNGMGAAGGTGMLVDRSWVSATDTWFLGGDLHYDFGGHGGYGIEAVGSAVHLVRCTCTGGQNSTLLGQCGFYVAGHGLVVRNPLGTWLSDCTLVGGNGNCGVAGDGLHNEGPGAVQLARATATGGPGQTPGVPLFGPTQTAPLLGLGNSPGAVTLGATYRVDWRAAPGTPVFAVLSTELAPRSNPLAVQRSWLPTLDITLAGIAVADASGTATFTLPVPAMPALRYQSFWLHGHAGLTTPLQTTPPLGGVAR